jgi:hypothetical protein
MESVTGLSLHIPTQWRSRLVGSCIELVAKLDREFGQSSLAILLYVCSPQNENLARAVISSASAFSRQLSSCPCCSLP